MTNMDFPGNSKHVTGAPTKKDKPPKEVQKVVTVDAVKRKKPLGRRFKELFLGGEVKGATSYILGDVLVPALRNLLVDATTKGVERVVYGDSSPRRRYESGRPRISYHSPIDSRYSTSYSRERVMLPDQPPRTVGRRQDLGEIILASRQEAETVLERLTDIVETYDVATVADLHEMVGLPSTHIDQKWGWTALKYANIKQIREGFLLDLPLPEAL